MWQGAQCSLLEGCLPEISPDTWHAIPPIYIILTPSWPVQALLSKCWAPHINKRLNEPVPLTWAKWAKSYFLELTLFWWAKDKGCWKANRKLQKLPPLYKRAEKLPSVSCLVKIPKYHLTCIQHKMSSIMACSCMAVGSVPRGTMFWNNQAKIVS